MSLESKHRKKYFSTFTPPGKNYASVAELVDALDSKSSSFGSVGSIPTRGTSLFFIFIFLLHFYCKETLIFTISSLFLFLANLIHLGLLETENFELRFAEIYPSFTKNLVRVVDNLTPSEIKVCMCVKMSYSNAQILDHFKISQSTLANLRSSIRHKIGLSRSTSLTNAILSI